MEEANATDELQRGREAHAQRAWAEARESLSQADQAQALEPLDLELLATSVYMLGDDEGFATVLDRAHHAYLDAGDALPAVRCAFWIGVSLMQRGEVSRGSGWLGRAQRLLDREESDCVERGYLLLPVVLQHAAAGEHEAAYAAAAEAAEIGERFGDADLHSLAVHEQGHALVGQGRIEQGLRLLDEAMVAVTAGELSPIVTGILYCSVIDGCQQVYALRRAQEWTAALTQWCQDQPDIVSFTGRCLVHRAEIMEVHGAWDDALDQAHQAAERLAQHGTKGATGEAFYRQGEVHRLRGEIVAAEEAYQEASRCGREPQPGLALLRLGQGREDVAAASIRRAVAETTERLKRARLLPALVEIMLAIDDVDAARAACHELEEIAEGYQSGMLEAMVSHARGAVDVAAGEAAAALIDLRRAGHAWQELDAPYESARVRVLVGMACRELGDEDTAKLELEAARGTFQKLGATFELARLASLTDAGQPTETAGLTSRELEVLRLVAAGKSNREIAAELIISEHTVARHMQNIFAKLGVSSRTAASSFAFEHDLL